MKKSELRNLVREELIKLNESSFKKDVQLFIDYTWQEDAEIQFVTDIERHINKPESALKSYMQRLYKANEKQLLMRTSDLFIGVLDNLLQ